MNICNRSVKGDKIIATLYEKELERNKNVCRIEKAIIKIVLISMLNGKVIIMHLIVGEISYTYIIVFESIFR